MNYKTYKKIINEVILTNQRNKTMQNKIKALKELDNGNKELRRMQSFLTNELICKMVDVLGLRTVEDYLILTRNHEKLNIPVEIINELTSLDRNVVRELCISEEDLQILDKDKVDNKLKIVASIIFNFNYLIEILSSNKDIEQSIEKLLGIKDLTEIPYDETFIDIYGKENLKKIVNNTKLTNQEIVDLYNEYPNIFDYINEDFELSTMKLQEEQESNNELNRIIGSLVRKL